MRVFNTSLIALLSCIAMVGATPVGNNAAAEAISRREEYVPYLYMQSRGGSDLTEKYLSSTITQGQANNCKGIAKVGCNIICVFRAC